MFACKPATVRIGSAGLFLALATVCLPCSATIAAGRTAVDPAGQELRVALAAAGHARVVIVLRAADTSVPASKRILSAEQAFLDHFSDAEFVPERRYVSFPAVAGKLSTAGLETCLAQPEVVAVALDTEVRAQLAESVPLIGLDRLHDAGWDGTGVRVAVIDSGYDATHPDLAASLAGERCFCLNGCCPDGSGDQNGPGSARDDNGHGTAVSGVIVSQGVVAPRGAAPGAQVVAVRVLDRFGRGFVSDLLAGLDWVAVARPDVRIVNISLAASALFPGVCDDHDALTRAFAAASAALVERGVSVFAATGNDAATGAMPAPACVSGTISVGAVWDTDFGPIDFGRCAEPETAPDRLLCLSNRSAATDILAPGGPLTIPLRGGGTGLFLGTSYASPMAVGCAAALVQAYPSLPPEVLRAAIKETGRPVRDPVTGRVFPRIDCLAALRRVSAIRTTVVALRLPVLGLLALILVLFGMRAASVR